MAVHEQGTLADVQADGVNVPAGVRAQLTVNPTRTCRLPAPYSDCQHKVRHSQGSFTIPDSHVYNQGFYTYSQLGILHMSLIMTA